MLNEAILKAAGVPVGAQERLRHYLDIEARIIGLEREVAAERQRHLEANRALQARRLAVQAECDHPESAIKYHGDPAGGSDSSDHCQICDASAKHLRREAQP